MPWSRTSRSRWSCSSGTPRSPRRKDREEERRAAAAEIAGLQDDLRERDERYAALQAEAAEALAALSAELKASRADGARLRQAPEEQALQARADQEALAQQLNTQHAAHEYVARERDGRRGGRAGNGGPEAPAPRRPVGSHAL